MNEEGEVAVLDIAASCKIVPAPEKDNKRIEQRTPPRKGICRRCGLDKPINRLMLCYSCWVKTELEDKRGWREGMPHPDGCGCVGLGEHKSQDGTSRGLN